MSVPDKQAQNHDQAKKPDELAGQRLGGYRLLRLLGQGAMAVVYMAEQESLKRLVAVKILKPDLALDKTYRARFQREAEAAASLVHANIVQIHEVGAFDDFNYIVQEYVDGQNLRQWIAENPKPTLPQTLSIICQVAAALAKASEQNIVHRDIKPENILIATSGEVKVADFGLARIARQDEGVDLTQVGITLGTPLYMSPEQVEGKTLDPRSDIYSLGVTCYHMLAGRPPFSGQTPLAIAIGHLKKDPVLLAEVREDLHPQLCHIVHRMLAKKPADRYQSAACLIQDLHRLISRLPNDIRPDNVASWTTATLESVSASRVGATQKIQALMDKEQRQKRSYLSHLALVAIVFVAFIAGGLLSWFTHGHTKILDGGLLTQETTTVVPREKTVLLQWLAATRADNENAWLAVMEYYPDKKNYVRRARQQLARLYLRNGDDVRALEVFRQIADADPVDKELQAFGLAGQCIVLDRLGRKKESDAIHKTLEPNLQNLKDSQLRRQLLAVRKSQ